MGNYTLNNISDETTQARIHQLLLQRLESVGRADRAHDLGLYSAEWQHRRNAERFAFDLLVIVGLIRPAYEFEAHSRQIVDCQTSG